MNELLIKVEDLTLDLDTKGLLVGNPVLFLTKSQLGSGSSKEERIEIVEKWNLENPNETIDINLITNNLEPTTRGITTMSCNIEIILNEEVVKPFILVPATGLVYFL